MNFEPDLRNQIVYYKFSGEVNTENLLNELKQHAVARDIKFVAVQSETGIFALNATEDFQGSTDQDQVTNKTSVLTRSAELAVGTTYEIRCVLLENSA